MAAQWPWKVSTSSEPGVPDRNGAGIRLEKGKLSVHDCIFLLNENGILTANDASIELDIRNSEFGYNGFGNGQSHNLYAGAIARLSVSGSYFHHANVGHLLKTRAAINDVRYNRLTDEPGGRAIPASPQHCAAQGNASESGRPAVTTHGHRNYQGSAASRTTMLLARPPTRIP